MLAETLKRDALITNSFEDEEVAEIVVLRVEPARAHVGHCDWEYEKERGKGEKKREEERKGNGRKRENQGESKEGQSMAELVVEWLLPCSSSISLATKDGHILGHYTRLGKVERDRRQHREARRLVLERVRLCTQRQAR